MNTSVDIQLLFSILAVFLVMWYLVLVFLFMTSVRHFLDNRKMFDDIRVAKFHIFGYNELLDSTVTKIEGVYGCIVNYSTSTVFRLKNKYPLRKAGTYYKINSEIDIYYSTKYHILQDAKPTKFLYTARLIISSLALLVSILIPVILYI